MGLLHVVHEPWPDPKGGGRAQARDLTGISPSDEGASASDIMTHCHLVKGESILYDDILTAEDDNA